MTPGRLPPTLVLAFALALLAPSASAAPKKALFDNTKAETAGNADWIIDTDQPLPLPDQSTVTPATPRTYWLGAISSYGIDLVKRGYSVATLTTAYGITYGNPSNPYDLSNYDVFIVPEPNSPFSAAEATAILAFVRDGGGLIAIGDHDVSDRNGDGWDSPEVWNAMDPGFLLGVHWGTASDTNDNITQDSGNHATAPGDSIIFGPNGVADSLSFHGGTTLTLYPGVNPSVRGEVWMKGLAQTSTTGVMAASSVYGNGRVFFIGDSSPVDDGSAQPGNSSIFDGWGEAAGRDSLLFLNATMWATRRSLTTWTITASAGANGTVSPSGGVTVTQGASQAFTITPATGHHVADVMVDGGSVGAVTSYTFDNVLANHTLEATFAADALDVGDGPAVFALAPALPNPAHGAVRFAFSLASQSAATVEVLDVAGRRVATLARDSFGAGPHELRWDGRDADGRRARAGVYFVRLHADAGTRVRRFARMD